MDEKLLFLGDNGNLISTDYKFEDYGDDILPKIEKMPTLDLVIKHYSQYHPQLIDLSKTGCTVMSGINAYATICNRDFTIAEIRDVYKLAIERGFQPGKSWSRSEGRITVKKWLDVNDPQYKSLLFTVNLFSDEFRAYIKKFGTVGISINVDSAYWKDARDDLEIDGDQFGLTGGHATDMMLSGKFFCPDSIPRDKIKSQDMPMMYSWGDIKKIERLRENKNIRLDCHIIILESRLKELDPKEKIRLESMKVELQKAIDANSAIWNLTQSVEEKKVRNEQNNYNRGKLAIINGMLS